MSVWHRFRKRVRCGGCQSGGMDTLPQALERVSKRQRTLNERIHTNIDKLIGTLQSAKDKLSQLPNTATEAETAPILAELSSTVKEQAVSDKVAQENKEFYGVLTKFGKSLDKQYVGDVCQALRPIPIDERMIGKMIALHFLHYGRFDMLDVFRGELASVGLPYPNMPRTQPPSHPQQEAPDAEMLSADTSDTHAQQQQNGAVGVGVGASASGGEATGGHHEVPEAMIEAYKQLHQISAALDGGDVSSALRWLEGRSKAEGARYRQLTFRLHELEFLRLLSGGKGAYADGLAYAQQHFPSFWPHMKADIAKLMASIAFGDHTDSPYAMSQADVARKWRDTRKDFLKAFCEGRRKSPPVRERPSSARSRHGDDARTNGSHGTYPWGPGGPPGGGGGGGPRHSSRGSGDDGPEGMGGPSSVFSVGRARTGESRGRGALLNIPSWLRSAITRNAQTESAAHPSRILGGPPPDSTATLVSFSRPRAFHHQPSGEGCRPPHSRPPRINTSSNHHRLIFGAPPPPLPVFHTRSFIPIAPPHTPTPPIMTIDDRRPEGAGRAADDRRRGASAPGATFPVHRAAAGRTSQRPSPVNTRVREAGGFGFGAGMGMASAHQGPLPPGMSSRVGSSPWAAGLHGPPPIPPPSVDDDSPSLRHATPSWRGGRGVHDSGGGAPHRAPSTRATFTHSSPSARMRNRATRDEIRTILMQRIMRRQVAGLNTGPISGQIQQDISSILGSAANTVGRSQGPSSASSRILPPVGMPLPPGHLEMHAALAAANRGSTIPRAEPAAPQQGDTDTRGEGGGASRSSSSGAEGAGVGLDSFRVLAMLRPFQQSGSSGGGWRPTGQGQLEGSGEDRRSSGQRAEPTPPGPSSSDSQRGALSSTTAPSRVGSESASAAAVATDTASPAGEGSRSSTEGGQMGASTMEVLGVTSAGPVMAAAGASRSEGGPGGGASGTAAAESTQPAAVPPAQPSASLPSPSQAAPANPPPSCSAAAAQRGNTHASARSSSASASAAPPVPAATETEGGRAMAMLVAGTRRSVDDRLRMLLMLRRLLGGSGEGDGEREGESSGATGGPNLARLLREGLQNPGRSRSLQRVIEALEAATTPSYSDNNIPDRPSPSPSPSPPTHPGERQEGPPSPEPSERIDQLVDALEEALEELIDLEALAGGGAGPAASSSDGQQQQQQHQQQHQPQQRERESQDNGRSREGRRRRWLESLPSAVLREGLTSQFSPEELRALVYEISASLGGGRVGGTEEESPPPRPSYLEVARRAPPLAAIWRPRTGQSGEASSSSAAAAAAPVGVRVVSSSSGRLVPLPEEGEGEGSGEEAGAAPMEFVADGGAAAAAAAGREQSAGDNDDDNNQPRRGPPLSVPPSAQPIPPLARDPLLDMLDLPPPHPATGNPPPDTAAQGDDSPMAPEDRRQGGSREGSAAARLPLPLPSDFWRRMVGTAPGAPGGGGDPDDEPDDDPDTGNQQDDDDQHEEGDELDMINQEEEELEDEIDEIEEEVEGGEDNMVEAEEGSDLNVDEDLSPRPEAGRHGEGQGARDGGVERGDNNDDMEEEEETERIALPQQSPLSVAVCAGMVALPRLMQFQDLMSNGVAGDRGQEWLTSHQIPIELDLGRPFHFHSHFTCPVTRTQTSSANPPVLLTCGHCISKACLDRISRTARAKFKCPICPQQMHASQVKRLQV
ncbi:unnamed protein product [Vitrella brassicaformis CCMP3155]|uniref:Uncharacterized protein n=3 Tax=Vitrella brassicaformis TaxID=1169539 RepID=A0A0G4EEE5_VITBC|nr:unnamed protein product [Vitrella brassicaformis CCMP3155]|eukprot:CEL93758.1 unnamed protein product [Vitrella brassicaformis CCMP3155]